MATRFEFVLAGENAVRLRAAGEEALDEIDRLEAQLSIYRSGSEIAEVNRFAAAEPVRVSPEVFALLERARELSRLTGGAFDITIAPLVRCWGFMRGDGSRPTDEELGAARELVGIERLELNEADCTVRFQRHGMMLDLGSIGKGYALDKAAEILRDAGIERALLHGGTSTLISIGTDADGSPWKIAVDTGDPRDAAEKSVVAVVELVDESLSVSAVSGKSFILEGKMFGHVLDPRTGWPTQTALLGAAIQDSAAASDAISTAILLAKPEELIHLASRIPKLRYLQVSLDKDEKRKVLCHGIEPVRVA